MRFDHKLTDPLVRQIFLFISVGTVCYMVAILLLMFFVEVVQLEVNLANLLSSVITIFVTYLLNAKFVFKGGRYTRKKEILAFFIFSFFGLVLNVLLMFLMTTYLPIWYVISKTVVVITIAVFNFVARKKFVFLE